MNRNLLNATFLFVLVTVIASMMYLSTDMADQQYAQIEQSMRATTGLNTRIDTSVLALRLGLDCNYDRLTHDEKKLANLEPPMLVNLQARREKLDILNQIDNKITLVNDFKSNHAIVKNAFAGFTRNVQIATDYTAAAGRYKQMLADLGLAGHQFFLSGAASERENFEKTIAELVNRIKIEASADIDFENTIGQVVRNAEKLIELRGNLDETVSRLIKIPIANATTRILEDAASEHQRVVAKRTGYRNILSLAVLALVGFCSSQLVSLIRSSKQVRDANEQLEERVAIRTSQLTDANCQLAEAIKESDKLAMAIRYTDNAVVIADCEGRIEWVNEGFQRCTGYKLDEVIGEIPGHLLQGEKTDPATIEFMRGQLARNKGFNVEILNYTKSGRAYWAAIEVKPIRNENGDIEKYIAIERDITERKKGQQEREQLTKELQEAARLARLANTKIEELRNAKECSRR